MPPAAPPFPAQPLPPPPGYTYQLPPPPAPPAEPSWYGYQTLAIDAAGLLAGAAAASLHETAGPDIGVLAATWYAISAAGAPAVHYAHGRMGIGLADFGTRLVAPPLVGLIGLFLSCTTHGDYDDECVEDSWGVSMTVGLGLTAVADALLFAEGADGQKSVASPLWYGWQILLVDVAAYSAGMIGVASGWRTKSGDEIHPALGTWAIGYTISAIGAPLVHFSHGRVGVGFISLGARLIIGPIGALPGLLVWCGLAGDEDDCAGDGAQWGLLAGGIAVSLFDAFALAYERAPVAPPSYGPSVSVGPGSLAISGYF